MVEVDVVRMGCFVVDHLLCVVFLQFVHLR